MTDAHPNAVLAGRLWEAFCDGDASLLEELLSPGVVWRSAGRNALAGEVKGVPRTLERIARGAEDVEDLRSRLLDVFANDRGAVLWIRTHAERGPLMLDVDYLLLLRIEDGSIYEVSAVPMDQQRVDEFWRFH